MLITLHSLTFKYLLSFITVLSTHRSHPTSSMEVRHDPRKRPEAFGRFETFPLKLMENKDLLKWIYKSNISGKTSKYMEISLKNKVKLKDKFILILKINCHRIKKIWKGLLRVFWIHLKFKKITGRIRLVREKISRYANNFNIYHFKQILKININLPSNKLSGHQK